MNCYHYSHGIHLPAILDCGYLRPSTAGVPIGETPAVWFTIRDDAQNIYPAVGSVHEKWSLQKTHETAGVVRFTIDESSAPNTWQHHKKHGGIHRKIARGLYQLAVRQGDAPTQWRLSYGPVYEQDWLAVEVWTGNGWEPVTEAVIQELRERRSNMKLQTMNVAFMLSDDDS